MADIKNKLEQAEQESEKFVRKEFKQAEHIAEEGVEMVENWGLKGLRTFYDQIRNIGLCSLLLLLLENFVGVVQFTTQDAILYSFLVWIVWQLGWNGYGFYRNMKKAEE